jgi:uncharacterized phage protein (TIGR02220 family)
MGFINRVSEGDPVMRLSAKYASNLSTKYVRSDTGQELKSLNDPERGSFVQGTGFSENPGVGSEKTQTGFSENHKQETLNQETLKQEKQPAHPPDASNPPSSKNNESEKKKRKKTIYKPNDFSREVINYYLEKSGGALEHDDSAVLKLISGRRSKKVTVQQIKEVIDYKFDEWFHSKKMRPNFTLQILLKPKNFRMYVGQVAMEKSQSEKQVDLWGS